MTTRPVKQVAVICPIILDTTACQLAHDALEAWLTCVLHYLERQSRRAGGLEHERNFVEYQSAGQFVEESVIGRMAVLAAVSMILFQRHQTQPALRAADHTPHSVGSVLFTLVQGIWLI